MDNHGLRYYDPEIGRYLTRDPIGYGDGMNVYQYVGDNPINRVDPMGLEAKEDALQAVWDNTGGAFLSIVSAGQKWMNRVTKHEQPRERALVQQLDDARTKIDNFIGGNRESLSYDVANMGLLFVGSLETVSEKGLVRGTEYLGEKSLATSGEKLASSLCKEESEKLLTKLPEGSAPTTGATKGGTYGEVRSANEGGQVHHIPSDQVNGLPKTEGPSIHMDTADHMETASWGSSREAQAFRIKEKELIQQGRFQEAQHLGVDDIRAKFGSKYDEHLDQLPKYQGPDPK